MCQRVTNPNTGACTLAVGDVILIRGVNPNTITNNSIIVFRPYPSTPDYLVVHRVVRVFPATQYSQVVYFWTRGDANPANDSWDVTGGGIPGDGVVGVYQFTIPKPTVSSDLGTVHSSSSFSQKSNSVVQTTTSQYQLPTQLVQPPLSLIDSINLTASRASSTSQGSLSLVTIFPVSDVAITYHNTPSQIQLNASILIYFSPGFQGTSLAFLANQAAFQSKWTSTLGNTTLLSIIRARIENAANHTLAVTLETKLDSINTGSASFSIKFVGQRSIPAADFGTTLENILNSAGPLAMGVGPIIRSALGFVTGESTTLAYTGSARTISFKSTITFVVDLDAQINKLKNQYFQLILSNIPAGVTIPASVRFLNSTSIAISQISATNDLDLSTGTSQTSLKGLVLKPPIVGSNTNFTIPGLFQIIGTIQSPGLNLTIVAGSNATYSMKITVPGDAPQPSSKTASSATWTNLHDAGLLSEVRFTLQRSSSSSSFLDALTSPLGIAAEAIVAVGAVTGAVLYLRRRRSVSSLVPSATPTPPPSLGPGPSPASP